MQRTHTIHSPLIPLHISCDAIRDKVLIDGAIRCIPGAIYLSRTIGPLGLPVPDTQKIFKRLSWKNVRSIYTGSVNTDRTLVYNLYLSPDGTEQVLPAIEYAGAEDVERSWLDGTNAIFLPLPLQGTIWGDE